MDNIINIIKNSQDKYLEGKNKEYIKKKSQFFTPDDIAYKMIKTINLKNILSKETIYILEPSAGCGILIGTLIRELMNSTNDIKEIYIDAYENDMELASLLRSNLIKIKKVAKEKNNINIKYKVIQDNFIIRNRKKWSSNKTFRGYDIIISNPPYKKINQESEEACIMNNIIHGQPNLYTLFIAMSIKMLNYDGIYTVLSPRNYLTGEYSKLLRKYILKKCSLKHIHSFGNRHIFTSVNQEVIISTFQAKQSDNKINIMYNEEIGFVADFEDIILDKESMSIVVPKKI